MGGRIICALPPKSLHFTCVQNQIKIRDQDEWDGETKGGQEKAKNWFDRMDGKIEEIGDRQATTLTLRRLETW